MELSEIRNKYKVIYADCPWDYKRKGGKKHIGTAAQVYPTMTDQEIYNLPVEQISDDNSLLFLWATWPKLQEALNTISAWGFTYKTVGFVWVKTNKISQTTLFWGPGHYTRANTEICLLGVRGKPSIKSHGVHQVVLEEEFSIVEFVSNIKHSKKPDVIRQRIVELCGEVPRIELFARELYEGRDAWSDVVEKISEV